MEGNNLTWRSDTDGQLATDPIGDMEKVMRNKPNRRSTRNPKRKPTRNPKKYHQGGGLAVGPRHSGGGIPGLVGKGKNAYPIEFEGGEFIMQTDAVDKYGEGFMKKVNQGQFKKGDTFKKGGGVKQYAGGRAMAQGGQMRKNIADHKIYHVPSSDSACSWCARPGGGGAGPCPTSAGQPSWLDSENMTPAACCAATDEYTGGDYGNPGLWNAIPNDCSFPYSFACSGQDYVTQGYDCYLHDVQGGITGRGSKIPKSKRRGRKMAHGGTFHCGHAGQPPCPPDYSSGMGGYRKGGTTKPRRMGNGGGTRGGKYVSHHTRMRGDSRTRNCAAIRLLNAKARRESMGMKPSFVISAINFMRGVGARLKSKFGGSQMIGAGFKPNTQRGDLRKLQRRKHGPTGATIYRGGKP